MAKKALLDVLEQTIGKYVKNLDAESLNVAVWSGKIALNSLELDVEAVNNELDRQAAETPNLALPFKVITGKFDTFEVDVPWASLTSRPVVLRAHGLEVNVEPFDRLAQADHLSRFAASEAKRTDKIRKARIKSIETSDNYRQQTNAMKKLAMSGGTSSESSSTFSSRLVRRIIENIQIEISDVHISLANSDGEAGVILESLSLITTDPNGKKVFVDRTAETSLANSFLFKKLQIEGFGIYLDDAFADARTKRSSSTISSKTLSSISESFHSEVKTHEHTFVLAPLSFQARLRQADSNVCVDNAKYQLFSDLSSLSVILSRNQLDIARKISKEISSTANAACPLFPEYRPLSRISKDTARDWWKYAVRCIGRLNGRSSWMELFKAFQKRQRYIPLYRRHAHHIECPWITPLNAIETEELNELEQDRSISVDGIMAWRNIADARVEKEREKHNAQRSTKEEKSRGYLSSIFGSSKQAAATTNTIQRSDSDAPPIDLSLDELKELEKYATEDFADAELSKDSKLCDIKFVLNSLKIDLIAYDLRNIAALNMGAVSMDFKAAADGAYLFDFDLLDLEIRDGATPNSLFPRVLRTIENVSTSENRQGRGAFNLHLSKNKDGDQQLDVKLAEIEAVASQLFLRELKGFVSESKTISSGKKARRNPLLAQSISGSVDLFYDADEGESTTLSQPMPYIEAPTALAPSTKNVPDFSNLLVDAWKEKTETKAAWTLDVDINAPIVIIPESCSDVNANVLVFDLGHLRINYGKLDPAPNVKRWFTDNSGPIDTLLDSGSVSIRDLTFQVGKNCDLALSSNPKAPPAGRLSDDSSVVEPISIVLDLGIESSTSSDSLRICCMGVIPTISMRFAPSQGSMTFPVIESWKSFMDEISDPYIQEAEIADHPQLLSDHIQTLAKFPQIQDSSPEKLDQATSLNQEDEVKYKTMHFMIGLQKLSIALATEQADRLEVHLVSVYASSTFLSDGSSLSGLKMGWFWVLDRLPRGDFPRRQRLLAHSKLPLAPEKFAEDDKYEILQELTKQGVFERDYTGSTDLADISLRKIGNRALNFSKDDAIVDNVLNAKFSSLSIHWNPNAVKNVHAMIDTFVQVAFDSDRNALIVPQASMKTDSPAERLGQSPTTTRTLIKAEMESLDLHLNSVIDDLPLFSFIVSGAKIDILSDKSDDVAMEASLSLGDLRVTTPGNAGRTLSAYRTLVGLAPGHTDSLLTVKFYQGERAVRKLSLDTVDVNQLAAFAEVELSPMRLSYIHSQVLALTEFITEGILGVITAKAASSAAEAAREAVATVSGKQVFSIKATSFDVVMPEAAFCGRAIIIHAGKLNVEHSMLPNQGGSTTSVTLSDVSLKDSDDNLMQEENIRMSVDVRMPSMEVGSLDDQALRVNVAISQASFVLSKAQYRQIMQTLDGNMGQLDLFLRDNSTQLSTSQKVSPSDKKMSHAGMLIVEIVRRMYVTVNIEELALQLINSTSEPLLRLAAVSTVVLLKQLPDQKTMKCEVSLRNLVCEDRRTKSRSAQYRYLFDQSNLKMSEEQTNEKSLAHIAYSSDPCGSTIALKVGSPRVVLIPDAISEISAFFQTPESSTTDRPEVAFNAPDETPTVSSGNKVIRVESTMSGDDIETTLMDSVSNQNLRLVSSKISVETSLCKIVLVDLGSQIATEQDMLRLTKQTSFSRLAPLTETMVLQGIFSASLNRDSDIATGQTVSADFRGQGESMEIYSAFGREMKSPVQILEPMEGSAHGSLQTTKDGLSEIEIRAAALQPVELIISTHNAALLSAILNSLSESFSSADASVPQDNAGEVALSEEERKRIEQLAMALASPRDHDTDTNGDRLSCMDDASVAASIATADKRSVMSKIQVKMTMPETTVTVVNDLQGLDEALFRICVVNFVTGCVINFGSDPSSSNMTFDFHLHMSVLADYFDSSMNYWNKLLTKPWELTLKGVRSPNRRTKTKRFSTAFDIESFPCHISFSEQFLVSLASAYRMWSIYSTATTISNDEELGNAYNGMNTSSIKHSLAASAARNLISSLPYAIDNHCGEDICFSLAEGGIKERACPSGTMDYFRFEPPKGKGSAGKRAYGQDVKYRKTVSIHINDSMIEIQHLDSELGLPRRAHRIAGGRVLMTQVTREGKTIVLHLASFIDICNHTSFPFGISLVNDGVVRPIGICKSDRLANLDGSELKSKESSNFSLPIGVLTDFAKVWGNEGKAKVEVAISPDLTENTTGPSLSGTFDFIVSLQELRRANNGFIRKKIDVICRPESQFMRSIDPFVVQVQLHLFLSDELHPYVEVCLEPRATVENKIPVAIQVQTPMPHTFSSLKQASTVGEKDSLYSLDPGDRIEVFTPGPSIALKFRISPQPVAGSALGWLEHGWIDLPLVSEFQLRDPIVCLFPFSNDDSLARVGYGARGSEFYIVEGVESLVELGVVDNEAKRSASLSNPLRTQKEDTLQRSFFVTVRNYGVDHTGDILFEQVDESDMNESSSNLRRTRSKKHVTRSRPFSAFASARHRRRISLLPAGNVPIRLLQLTMEQDSGWKKSLPFYIEDIAIGEGGIETTPIYWENKKPTGYFAYRSLANEHQSEIHIVPEYIVFNGSENAVLVKERGKPEILIESGKVSQLRIDSREKGLDLAFSFFEMGCQSNFVSVGGLGLKVAFLTSAAGYTIGSVYVQTVIDTHGDARLVVKIGELVTGNLDVGTTSSQRSMFSDDFFRFRLRWTELQLILNETPDPLSSGWSPSEHVSKASQAILAALRSPQRPSVNPNKKKQIEQTPIALQPVAAIVFSRFTFDFQRVFKETVDPKGSILSPERSQVSLIVHNVQIKDLTPDSAFPIVFNCSSQSSFFDLCIRIRGPLDVDLVTVDLLDLNLAYGNGRSERMTLTTSEEFVWKIVDLVNRILAASGEFTGVTLTLEEDEKHGGFTVKILDPLQAEKEDEVAYTPPKGDRLYDVTLARVSPVSLLVTFRRNPNTSRYQKFRDVRFAKLMNYFTRRLKFTIEKAELNFARYEDRGVKGPPDRLIENLTAVYMSRMKFKLMTLLSAATLQDWKYLAARDTGDDEYVEGDILRATGNLAGKTGAMLFKQVGSGLGAGVSGLTRAVGGGIEKSTNVIGARRVGEGLNDAVTGVGDGVASTLTGVGSGAGKVVLGVGQGIGQVFGGVVGGGATIAKGIGKGIVKGDGKAVVDGFAQGANTVGGGIAQGAESAVMGTADGFLSAGKGVVSGFKSVGRGIGSAVTGVCPCFDCPCSDSPED